MVEIKQRLLTNNDCYKAGKKITPKGIMVHSTGANNPKLSRYIQPDDGILGKNAYANDWNRSGISKCVHGFIGKDKNGTVRIYQTLDWNHRGWHGGGKSNDTHIGFEICEDGLNDKDYFNAVYNAAVELCVYLCKKFNLTEKDILCHSEGYKKGIASNHADVMHWFPKHGKSMDSLRADVKGKLATSTSSKPVSKPVTQDEVKNSSVKADMKTNSIVDYLKSIGVNSSYANRQKLAKKYGIKNYTGSPTQNTQLLTKMRNGSEPKPTAKPTAKPTPTPKGDMKTNSIVDYLKSIGQNSSFSNRTKLAAKHGIKNYTGSPSQNTQLLKKLRG